MASPRGLHQLSETPIFAPSFPIVCALHQQLTATAFRLSPRAPELLAPPTPRLQHPLTELLTVQGHTHAAITPSCPQPVVDTPFKGVPVASFAPNGTQLAVSPPQVPDSYPLPLRADSAICAPPHIL